MHYSGTFSASIAELMGRVFAREMLRRHGLTVVNCIEPFGARWIITSNDELLVSPDLRGSDVRAIEDHLRQTRPGRGGLHLVPGPRTVAP